MSTFTKVFKSSSTVINPRDLSNYYGGGEVRNEMGVGGMYYSSTVIPELNKTSSIAEDVYMNNGEFLTLLGSGLVSISGIIDSYANLGDSINDSVNNIDVIKVTVTATSSDGTVIYYNENEHSFNDDVSSTLEQSGSLRDLAKAWGMKTDLTSLTSPLSIAMKMVNMTTQKEVTVESVIGGAVLGTVQSQLNNLAISAVAKAIGITSATAPVMVGALALNMVLNELEEMALGLDSHFGFGGDLQSTDDYGFSSGDRYSAPSSFVNELAKTLNSLIGTSYSTYANNYTTNLKGEINSWTDPSGEGEVTDLSSNVYGIDVTDKDIQTKVETELTDSYFGSGWGSDSSNEGYGDNSGDANSDSTGGGGYSSDGTIICTALAKHGVFTRKQLARQFRHTIATYPEFVYDGYMVWGSIIVDKINNSKSVKLWTSIMTNRWSYIEGRRTLRGFLANYMVVGLSYVVGCYMVFKKHVGLSKEKITDIIQKIR